MFPDFVGRPWRCAKLTHSASADESKCDPTIEIHEAERCAGVPRRAITAASLKAYSHPTLAILHNH